MNPLVAYFSATGTTARAAKTLAADDQYFCHDLSPVDDFGLHPHAAGRSALRPLRRKSEKNYPFSASSISRTILQATAVDAPL